uniref:Methyltransferase small domain-containing protein n=1 Tax=Streptomyces sp. NBC_00049 TaxID=2903617 RepID=A0AAU2JSS5_9ACTN
MSLVEALRAAGCVFAEEEAELLHGAARDDGHLADLLTRRVGGEPLEHVVGWAEFCGLRMEVGAGAFVPRRRTEFLVQEAVALARPGAVVLDLCCGVGALGAAVAAQVAGGVELHVADVDPAALAYARRNVAPYGGSVWEGDLYAALPASLRGRVDVLVVNAPYVPTEEIGLMPSEARDHEPLVSLDGGADGLDVHRRVAAGALPWLAPGGHLLIETSARQCPVTAAALTSGGLAARVVTSEELYATVVIGAAPERAV